MANSSAEAIPIEGLDITGNLTFVESIYQLPAQLWKHQDLFIIECKIVFAALACIWLGAHASLRRPPSASPPSKKKSKSGENHDDKDDQFVQGLVASDAIMFPILAGTVLVGLYYLIKWLEDPAIISKIMGIYFSVMSLGSTGKLLADTLHFITGFVFPDRWEARDGTLYTFEAARRCQSYVNKSGERVFDESRKLPFAGPLSTIKLTEKWHGTLWELSHILKQDWTIRVSMHGLGREKFHVKLNDIFGFLLAIAFSVLYQSTRSNFLSNVMGYAFSYVGIITLSPTSFTIGSSVLFGLFFYDIYMVFYTPYMVTVASKLDVPIKLVYESNKRSSMLGLGDIVVPGIFIGLCLRFDLFLHYYRQQKLVPVELETQTSSENGTVETKETQRIVRKPEYNDPKGQWGNLFWGKYSSPSSKAVTFTKTYFLAAMFGYLISMIATLVMLFVFKHAQPALLYLVPGVVSAVWITGILRGELKEMWLYTEDGSLDKQDIIVEVDGKGNVLKEIEESKGSQGNDSDEKTVKKAEVHLSQEASVDSTAEKNQDGNDKKKTSRTIFSFTIDAPDLSEEQQ